MTPQQFIAKWGPGGESFDLNERQGAQAHFMDLCQLLGVPTPGTATGSAQGGSGEYIFEQDTLVLGEARVMPTFSTATASLGKTKLPAKTWTRPSNNSSTTAWP